MVLVRMLSNLRSGRASQDIMSAATDDVIAPHVWKIAAVAMLGPLLTNLDSTVVNLSLDAIGRQLAQPLSVVQWISTGYLLSMALLLPLSGWLVDRIGAKQVYIGCFAFFTIASLCCGLSTTMRALIVFRLLQGASGGILAPMAQMMIARVAGKKMARVMGVSLMPVMLGPILGPLVAGLLLEHVNWPWVFYINLPIGCLATWLAWRVLPNDTHCTSPRRLDVIGFLLLAPSLALLVYSLDALQAAGGATSSDWARLLGGIGLFCAFLIYGAHRGAKALIHLNLFANKTFSVAACTQMLGNGIILGGQFVFPLYLIVVHAYSTATAGLLMSATGLGILLAFGFQGRLTERFGPKFVSSGGALVALLSTLPFMFIGKVQPGLMTLSVLLLVRGLGLGCINIPSISAAYASVPHDSLPMATTAINIVQRLGGPIVTTLLAIQLGALASTRGSEAQWIYADAFKMFCFLHLLTVFIAFQLPRFVNRQTIATPKTTISEASN